MPDIDTEELRRQGIALTYLETQRVLDALDAKDREIEALRRYKPCNPCLDGHHNDCEGLCHSSPCVVDALEGR